MPELLDLDWPTDSLVVVQPFGANPDYYHRFEMPGNPGIDLEATPGSEVDAPAAGSVVSVGDGAVRIRHEVSGRTYETELSPLSAITVSAGSAVDAGEVIGRAATGYVTLKLHSPGATGRQETAYPVDLVDPTPYLRLPDTLVVAGQPRTTLRAAPQTRAARVASVPQGDPLRVLRGWRDHAERIGRPRQWLYVESLADQQGWVNAGDVQTVPMRRDLAPPGVRVRVNVPIARLRAGPGTNYAITGRVAYGTVLDVVSNLQNAPALIGVDGKWLNIRTPQRQVAWIAAWLVVRAEPSAPPPPPPAPAWPYGRCLVGLHGKADPWPFEGPDYETVRLGRLEAVKLLTPGHGVETIRKLREINGNVFLMARLFAKPGDAPMSSVQFFEAVRDGVLAFYNEGIRYFEIHNEPNLDVDGLFKSWNNGAEFNTWYLDVLARLRGSFPSASFGFPGLSPGPAIPDRRQDWLTFLDQCAVSIEQSAWIGAHCYWQTEADMASPDGGGSFRMLRGRYPDKLVLITEFSNPAAGVSFDVKGDQYVRYYQGIRFEPGVGAAFSFVLSASCCFPYENWRIWQDGQTAIPARVGARPF